MSRECSRWPQGRARASGASLEAAMRMVRAALRASDGTSEGRACALGVERGVRSSSSSAASGSVAFILLRQLIGGRSAPLRMPRARTANTRGTSSVQQQ
eukprot:3054099-Prymnesium_polylepis.2